MSNMLPGGSLDMYSHLLPAFDESLNNVSHALSGLLTRLMRLPETVIVSPVCTVLSENCSLSILTNLLCSCACTPCACAFGLLPNTIAKADSTMTVARAVTTNVLLSIIPYILTRPERTRIYALLCRSGTEIYGFTNTN